MLQYAVALVGGAWALWPGRGRGGPARGIPPLALAFLWSTVAYLTVLSNAVEVGENTHFRLYTEPLVLLLAALVAAWARARTGSAPASELRSGSGSARRRRGSARGGT